MLGVLQQLRSTGPEKVTQERHVPVVESAMIEYILISAPSVVQLNVREDLKAAVRKGTRSAAIARRRKEF